jgi:hypothetical protein
MPKGFDLRCAAGKTARVWLQGTGGGVKPGYAVVVLPPKEGEIGDSPVAYMAPLRQALSDDNSGREEPLGRCLPNRHTVCFGDI